MHDCIRVTLPHAMVVLQKLDLHHVLFIFYGLELGKPVLNLLTILFDDRRKIASWAFDWFGHNSSLFAGNRKALNKSCDTGFDVIFRMRSRQLHTNAGLALRHYRKTESRDIDAAQKHLFSDLAG